MAIIPAGPHGDRPEFKARPRTRIVPAQAAPAAPAAAPAAPAAATPRADHTSTQDYEVGRGRPPKHSRFKPGQSGNPRGRPKTHRNLDTIVRERLLETVKIRTARGEKKVPRIEALIMKTIEAAGKGNLRAFERMIALFRDATPSTATSAAEAVDMADLSATDALTLALLRQQLLGDEQEGGEA